MTKTKQHRTWFMWQDGRFPSTLWVIYDGDANKISGIKLKLAQVFDLSSLEPLKFDVSKCKWSEVEYIRKWDFLHNSLGIPLMNERALALMESMAGGAFQAIPAEIHMPDGYVIKEYKLLNVIKKVPGILWDRSIVKDRYRGEEVEHDISYYKTTYHRLYALGEGEHLARSEEKPLAAIYGSDELKKAVKEAKLTGLKFRENYAGDAFWCEEE